LGAGCREHFGCLDGNVSRHDVLVVAPRTVNLQRGDTPGVELVFIHFDEVAVIGQALPETAHSHAPGTGHFDGVFELDADSGLGSATSPAVAAATALITVAADKFFLFGFYVAETRDVDAVGAVAE